MKPFLPFFVALQFLTRVPSYVPAAVDLRTTGRSILFYPLVGLMLGLCLAGAAWLLADAPPGLRAALVLAAWVLLTGALHLDGLADSADAWIGGIGDRTRTLAIMKDPHCGPAAVVALTIVLLIKFAALLELESMQWLTLALIPILARTAIPLLFLTTPYARPGGIGAALATHLPCRAAKLVVVTVAIAAVLLAGMMGMWLLLGCAATFLILRAMMQRRLGGTTGDTAGALVELGETAMLVCAALAPG